MSSLLITLHLLLSQGADPPAAPPADAAAVHRLLEEANDSIEEAVAARRTGDAGRAAALTARARRAAEVLDSGHHLPFTLERLETTGAWTDEQAARAVEAWGLLRGAEADPLHTRSDILARVLDSCRAVGDRWCEGRALAARAESFAQSPLPPEVRDDLLAAEPILREAGPSPILARTLVLMRGAGAPPAEMVAKARERYAEAVRISHDLEDPSIEGQALCETVRVDLTAGQQDAARANLDRVAAIAKSAGSPRVAACGAYFEGLSRYFARDPKGAREVWDLFAASPASRNAPRETIWILVGGSAASFDLLDYEGAVTRARRAVGIGSRLNGDADLLPAYCNLAGGLTQAGRRIDAEPFARRCLDLSRKHKRRDAEAAGLRRLGDLARNAEDALELHQQALAIHREVGNERDVGWSLVSVAGDLSDLGRLHDAGPLFEEGLSIADRLKLPDLRAFLLAGLGRVRAFENRLDEAERLADQALRSNGTEAWAARVRGFALRTRALARQNRHDYTTALADYLEAFDQFARVGMKGMQARAATDLGNLNLFLNRLDRAYDYYERALILAREAGEVEPERVAINNMELIKRRYRVTTQSKEFLVKAAREAAGRGWRPGEAVALLNLTEALASLGEMETAETAARRAVTLTRQLGLSDLSSNAHGLLASILSRAGRHEEALGACRAPLANEAALGTRQRIRSHAACGEVLIEAGRAAEAVEHLREALLLTEQSRDLVDQPELRATMMADKLELVPALVSAILSAAGPEPSPAIVGEAFTISERFRARSLLESLAREREEGVVPVDAKQRRAGLLSRMAELHLRQAGGAGENAGATLQEIRRLEAEWEESGVDSPGRKRRSLLGAEAIDLAGARSHLPDDVALLEYLLGERRGFLFIVTRQDARVVSVPSTEDLDERILLFRGLLERRGPDPNSDEKAIRALGEKLYETLIGPARVLAGRGINHLIVSPDQMLSFLPFEALVVPGGAEGNGPHYLAEDYEITLAPSMTVLAMLHSAEIPDGTERTLAAFADPIPIPASPDTATDAEASGAAQALLPVGLPPLPYSVEEIDHASRRLEGIRIIKTGRDATEAKVERALAGGYRIVHIAAHGFLDTYSIGRSGVVLTADPRTGDDGLLQAREILEIPVRTDLVVLSGCATGSGRYVTGEGVFGLPHALFQVGAPSIVMSLWQVGDRAAAIFMDRFYAGLARGLTLGAAMRQARLDLIRSGRRDLAHPSVWAPFVLAGVGDRAIFKAGAPARRRSGATIIGSAATAALSAVILWALRKRPRTAPLESDPEVVRASPPPPPAT